jgi:hypothetical protein
MFAKTQKIYYVYVKISINIKKNFLFFCRSNCFEQGLQHQAVEVSTQFQITKHLNLVVLFQRAKKFDGCFGFKVLKVELDPPNVRGTP